MSCTVISLNVCSIVRANRIAMLYEFIKQTNANIYLLQETQTDNYVKLKLPGYNILRGDHRRGQWGTAIIIDNNIPIRNLKIFRENIQATTVEVKLSDRWYKIASCYFPHHMTDNQNAIANFFAKNPNTFFGGDTNSRHANFGDISSNTYGVVLQNISSSTDLRIYNPNTPTCYRSETGSHIDKFLSNTTLMPSGKISVLPSFSDHLAIKCTLPVDIPDTDTYQTKLRLYNLTNLLGLNNYIERGLKQQYLPLRTNLTQNECENVANDIKDLFGKAVEKFVPTAKNKNHRVLLSEAARSILRHSKWLQRKLFTLGPLTPNHIRRPYLTQISLTKKMLAGHISSDTNKFFTNTFNSIESNRDAFDVIRRYTGHKKSQTITGSLFTNENKSTAVAGIPNIAMLLGENFAKNHSLTTNCESIHQNAVNHDIQNLATQNPIISFDANISPAIIDNKNLMEINNNLPPGQQNLLTSTEEVANIINTRPNKKSSGADSMPYSIMKQFNSTIILGLTIYFNHLIAIGYFPVCWQTAIITPIPKPGRDASLAENWRPISQLICLSKIYERIIASRLRQHLTSINILQNQFGFLPKHSTNHALARIQSDINDGLNKKRVTTLVALDLKAAFDTIWHDGVIHKMCQLNFPIYLIKIVQNMLGSRKFAVGLNGHITEWFNMGAGIPQGSVTGPLIFIIYVYDVPIHNFIKITQFADDTTLHVVHDDPARAQNSLNRYMGKLHKYFTSWRLSLNEKKTELIHILGMARDTNPKLRRLCRNMKIRVNNHTLPIKNNIRLLGLQLQTNNRFTKHITLRLEKAKRAKFHLNRIIKNSKINIKTKTTIYKMYIRPILMHGCAVWCRQPQVSSHQMELLRIFERSVLRSTANIRRERNSYKHVPTKNIYEASDCIRIDRFVVQNHIDFYNKLNHSNNPKFNTIKNSTARAPYQNMPYLWNQHSAGNLSEDDRVTLFNTRYGGKPGLVYNLD